MGGLLWSYFTGNVCVCFMFIFSSIVHNVRTLCAVKFGKLACEQELSRSWLRCKLCFWS